MNPEAMPIPNSLTGIEARKKIEEQIEKAKESAPKPEAEPELVMSSYEKRFKKILFVVTEVSASYGRALNPHLGVAMLMATLDKEGLETDVIDLQLDYTVEDVAKRAKEFGADLIGITMFSFDFINT